MMNILTDRLKIISSSKGWFYIFGVVSVVIIGITLLLALKLSPWLYAMNVRVKLHAQMPAETKINICWDKTQIQCLPLVPYLSIEKRIAKAGEIADVWLSELPPQSAYSLSLIFKSNAVKGIFQYLELASWPGILWGYIPEAGIRNTKLGMDEFKIKNIIYTKENNFYHFTGNLDSHFMVTQEIKPGPLPSSGNQIMTVMMLWGLLFLIYLSFAIPLYLVPFALQNLGATARNVPVPYYPWWVYAICSLAIVFMLLLIINSPALFDAYDPMFYLQLATGKEWFNPSRPPGYQLFLKLAFKLSGYRLNEIAILQATLLVISATSCIWTLRKWLHPIVAVVAIFFMLFSPVQTHWALSIMRESLFVSLVLLGITSVIAHFTTENRLTAKIWIFIFAIICGLVLFVRENGILMPVVLLPVLLFNGLKYLRSPGAIWTRIQGLFLMFIPYTLPVLGTCIVYMGLSTYNYLNYGYFQFTIHATSHHFLWQEISTSSFDSRSLLKPDHSMSQEAKTYLGQRLYRSFIVTRDENPGLDPIFMSFFPTINQISSERSQWSPVNWFHSAGVINEIGKSARTLLPWEADFVGLLRQYREFIVSNPSDTGGYSLLPDDSTGLEKKQQVLSQLEKNIHYDGKLIEPNSFIDQYYAIAQEYGWYRALFILALLFSLYLLRYGDPVFLTPITFFIANAFLLIILRGESPRFIECVDILLILQIALGLSHWVHIRFSITPEKSFPSQLINVFRRNL